MKKLIVNQVPDGIYEKVKAYADERGISISDAVKNILHEYFEEKEKRWL